MPIAGTSQLIASELVIFNCVPEGERDTSSQLAALIDRQGLFRSGETLAVARCNTPAQLTSTLQAVLARAQQGALPMLHFDGHASAEAMGTASKEHVNWDEIYSWFRKINIECKNNLFVTMGACEALRSFDRSTITQPCPVNALLAAWNPVLAAVVEVGLEAFYEALFKTQGDMDSALLAMRAAVDPCPLLFFSSQHYLEKGIFGYVREHCVGDGLRARISSVAAQARAQYPDIVITDELVARVMREEIDRTPAVLREMASRFMHIRADGTNMDRFGENLSAVLQAAQIELERERSSIPEVGRTGLVRRMLQPEEFPPVERAQPS